MSNLKVPHTNPLIFLKITSEHQGLQPFGKKSPGGCKKSGRTWSTSLWDWGENCPLHSLKKYLAKLHPACQWLFQRPDPNFEKKESWYINSPVGSKTIAKFMSKIASSAGLGKPYTNHSIRATTVTTLRNQGVHANDIMAVTGHQSAQSINSYSVVSETKCRQLSHQLSVMAGYSLPKTEKKTLGSLGSPTIFSGKSWDLDQSYCVDPRKKTTVSVSVTPVKEVGPKKRQEMVKVGGVKCNCP